MATKMAQYILIAASANATGNTTTGTISSSDNRLAPPHHGMRKRSWNVRNIPRRVDIEVRRQQIKLCAPQINIWENAWHICLIVCSEYGNAAHTYLSIAWSKSMQLQQQPIMWFRSLLRSKYSQQHKGSTVVDRTSWVIGENVVFHFHVLVLEN